jgi:hypothetical protein
MLRVCCSWPLRLKAMVWAGVGWPPSRGEGCPGAGGVGPRPMRGQVPPSTPGPPKKSGFARVSNSSTLLVTAGDAEGSEEWLTQRTLSA